MINLSVRILLCAFMVVPAISLAAERGDVGIVKGTITLSGNPAPDAVVSIEGLSAEQIQSAVSRAKTRQAVMNQRDMKFLPRVLAIVSGTAVDFPNNDTSWHNVYSKGGANDFDLGLYAPGKTRSVKFEKPGVSRILCNAHPNMEAFIVVKEHPFFAVTDRRGNFQINNVPLGKARVDIWYPNLAIISQLIVVGRDREVVVFDTELKP